MAMPEQVRERRWAWRRAELVDRLLPAVEMLLEFDVSYSELSVEQIISAASVARATFYRHFDDKTDLLLALSEPALAEVFAAATRPWDLAPKATRTELTAEIRRNLEAYRPHIRLMNAIVDLAASDSRVRERFQQGLGEVRAAIAEHIRRGQRAGYIRKDLPPDETAGWITWMGERGLAQLVPGASEPEMSRLADALTAIQWYTCYEGQSGDAAVARSRGKGANRRG